MRDFWKGARGGVYCCKIENKGLRLRFSTGNFPLNMKLTFYKKSLTFLIGKGYLFLLGQPHPGIGII